MKVDYESMSDFEINALVTSAVFGCEKWEYNDAEFYHCGIDGGGYYSQTILDYCNNPADAWSIITDNKISIMNDESTWEASIDYNGDLAVNGTDEVLSKYYEHEKPLRAAMIVFLMMSEQ